MLAAVVYAAPVDKEIEEFIHAMKAYERQKSIETQLKEAIDNMNDEGFLGAITRCLSNPKCKNMIPKVASLIGR
jgi:uncharacterized protein YaaR (DUF327 family)